MNKIELSLWIEANYPISGIGRPRKLLHGVGLNDADYITAPTVNGGVLWDPAYRAWAGMLERAYDPKCHARYPTYSDVTVCAEWHSFIAFRAWWLLRSVEGCSLDKDLLAIGNRQYSPDACIYVPRWLNNFTEDCGASRGELPIGVSFCKQTGRYRSECCNPITGKKHHLGRFTTPEASHEAWLKCKLSLAEQLKPEMDAIDHRIYPNVISIIRAAR